MDCCQNFKSFYRFCNLFVFWFYRMWFLVKVSDLLEKTPPDLLVFWLWFAPPRGSWPKETIGNAAKTSINFRNLCILKKIWRFFENLVSFLAFHFTDWHSSPQEMIFMKKSIRFAGFLAVIFTFKRKRSSEIYAFWKKSGDFLKILHLFCVQKLL